MTEPSQSGKVPKYVFVEYSGEAKYRDDIDIAYSESEDSVFLNGTRDGKRIFKLKMDY